MGWGDDILATVQARHMYERTGEKVFFNYWSPVFDHNPHISRGRGLYIKNHVGNRPYLLGSTGEKFVYNPNFHTVRGDIYLTGEEQALAAELTKEFGEFVLIDPHIKDNIDKQNKDWGWERWQALVDAMPINWVQLDYGKRALDGVKTVPSNGFRTSCSILQRAALLVCHEGGFAHAAAALRKDAVVIWGGFNHPKYLGYDKHINLRADDTEPCGNLKPCDHCRQMMEDLTVEEVAYAVSAQLDRRKSGRPVTEKV